MRPGRGRAPGLPVSRGLAKIGAAPKLGLGSGRPGARASSSSGRAAPAPCGIRRRSASAGATSGKRRLARNWRSCAAASVWRRVSSGSRNVRAADAAMAGTLRPGDISSWRLTRMGRSIGRTGSQLGPKEHRRRRGQTVPGDLPAGRGPPGIPLRRSARLRAGGRRARCIAGNDCDRPVSEPSSARTRLRRGGAAICSPGRSGAPRKDSRRAGHEQIAGASVQRTERTAAPKDPSPRSRPQGRRGRPTRLAPFPSSDFPRHRAKGVATHISAGRGDGLSPGVMGQ
jgi:hypothetical protein